MIIYILGYGRSGSTAVSKCLEQKLHAINLGEVKYLYRSEKDDLIDSYWIEFKEKELGHYSKDFKSFDNVFGFLKWNQKEVYEQKWKEIFDIIGIDLATDIIVDSSKTTLDSFMRGIYLYHSFKDVYFILPKRGIIEVFGSLLKGKNSNLERGEKKKSILRFLHVAFVGVPHLFITKLLTNIYNLYGVYTVDLKFLDEDIGRFIEKEKINIGSSKNKEFPMVYGNRMRLKD